MIDPWNVAEPGTEHAHQAAFFFWAGMAARYGIAVASCEEAYISREKAEYLQLRFRSTPRPELALMFAIPNGGLRNKVTAVRLKAEGVKAGVPDVFLPVACGNKNGLFIEFKRPTLRTRKNGGLSETQIDFIHSVREQAYTVDVVYSWDEAAKSVVSYFPKLGIL